MILNFHLLAGLILWPPVSARNNCHEQSCRLRTWSHAAEPITFPLTRRQWLPPRNSTTSTSPESTIWMTKTIPVDLSHIMNGPVPVPTSIHLSFTTTQVLEVTVIPGAYVQASQGTGPIFQTVPEVSKKSSSAAMVAHLSPLSYAQNIVPSTTATFGSSQTTGIPVYHQLSGLVVVPITTSPGGPTWVAPSAALSLSSDTKVGALYTKLSSSTSSNGGPSQVSNNTDSLDASSPTIIHLVPMPTSQHQHTSGIAQAPQSEATYLPSAFNLSTTLNQTRASGIFQGWNKTTSSAGALVTTQVISKSMSPTGHPLGLNNTSYHPKPSASSIHPSQSALSNLQSMAIVSTGSSSQNRDSSATISAAQSPNNDRITTTHTTTLFATQSATQSATGSPVVPQPLTTSQTAGVAIASTTGLLIAIVAVLYVARRHRANSARRSSTGSIYPKVAYLYDPPPDDHFEEACRNPTMMSEGIYTRSPSKPKNSQRMYDSSYQKHDSYGGSLPSYTYEAASEGQDAMARPRSRPRKQNSYTYTLTQSTNHEIANTDRNVISPLRSPTQRAGWQPLPPRPRSLKRSASVAQYSILSDISSAACSPHEELNTAKHARIPALRSSCSFPSTPRISEGTGHVRSTSHSQEDTSKQSRGGQQSGAKPGS